MADQWPAFEECMPERPLIQNYWRENDGEWLELVKQRYEETRKIIGEEATQATQASAEGGQTSNQIPRIIHHIWLGSPMPERLEKMRKTWIDMHPEPKWQHVSALGRKRFRSIIDQRALKSTLTPMRVVLLQPTV